MRGVCGGRGGVSLPDELDLDGALVLRGEAAGGRCGRGLRRRRRFFFFFFFLLWQFARAGNFFGCTKSSVAADGYLTIEA